jgi:hypothetical protein
MTVAADGAGDARRVRGWLKHYRLLAARKRLFPLSQRKTVKEGGPDRGSWEEKYERGLLWTEQWCCWLIYIPSARWPRTLTRLRHQSAVVGLYRLASRCCATQVLTGRILPKGTPKAGDTKYTTLLADAGYVGKVIRAIGYTEDPIEYFNTYMFFPSPRSADSLLRRLGH